MAAPAEPLERDRPAQRANDRGLGGGSSIDSEETLAFSALTGVRPRIEVFALERSEEAFAKMLQNRVRFRAVLTP